MLLLVTFTVRRLVLLCHWLLTAREGAGAPWMDSVDAFARDTSSPPQGKPFASQACALPDERSEDGKLKRLQFTQLPCSVKFYILFKLLVVNCLPPLVRGTVA